MLYNTPTKVPWLCCLWLSTLAYSNSEVAGLTCTFHISKIIMVPIQNWCKGCNIILMSPFQMGYSCLVKLEITWQSITKDNLFYTQLSTKSTVWLKAILFLQQHFLWFQKKILQHNAMYYRHIAIIIGKTWHAFFLTRFSRISSWPVSNYVVSMSLMA